MTKELHTLIILAGLKLLVQQKKKTITELVGLEIPGEYLEYVIKNPQYDDPLVNTILNSLMEFFTINNLDDVIKSLQYISINAELETTEKVVVDRIIDNAIDAVIHAKHDIKY